MKYIFIIAILFIFIFTFSYNIEKFSVDFNDYKVPYSGYCKADITDEQFKTGKYNTFCWGNTGNEGCNMLNDQGYNCGNNVETGEILPCKYFYGKKCKDDIQCHSSCYDNVGACVQPYMIKVESDNLIGLSASI